MWNLIFLFTGLIFLVLLVIIYFSKQKISSIENSIFKIFLLVNLIEYCVEIPLQIFVRTFGIGNNLVDIFTRIYIIFIFLIFSVFTVYTFFISIKNTDDNKQKKANIFQVVFTLYMLVNIVIISLLPLEKHYDGLRMYAYGTVVDYVKIQLTIYMVFWIVRLLINIKNIFEKKYIPVFVIIAMIIANVVLQAHDPSALISTVVATFICYTMYFTIENPDVKMIKQLQVARELAEKANSAKTDFLSSMSHEIRTPLNAIVGFSDCIMDAKDLGEAKENAKDIVNASKTLLEIVNGILDISKIEAGKIEIVNSKYDARETFEELAKLITPKMNEKGLDFTYNIAPDLPPVLFGDHANIKKVVTNLLSNACKYTDKGYVHYEVNCVNSKNVSKLIISVEDSGRGIKKDSVDKMFTKFQRLEEDKNTTIEGTGLGLAITKQLIELMGGRIIVHTVYGEGSKFTVVINQKIEASLNNPTKKVSTTLDLKDLRIMLVDDTPLNLKVAGKLLERYNANHVISVSSGFECIERIQRGEIYDLILLDDMMPKMSGVETLKKLKEIPGFKIPTIALTANAISGMREKYLADGFDDYLAKPIEKDQLIQVVNQILGRSATEDIQIPDYIKNENIDTPAIRDDIIAVGADSVEIDTPKVEIIPVEENIEEILGDKLERNFKEPAMEVIPIHIAGHDTYDSSSYDKKISDRGNMNVEVLEDTKVEEIPHIDVVPLVGVDNNTLDNSTNEGNVKCDRKYLEDNGVDVEHGLELLGDMDMYNMTINDFMSEVEDKWSRIVDYKEKNDMPNYAIEVHSLKSDCKYLGFMDLADIAYQHELKSKENDSEFVNNNFNELETKYKKVLEIAKNYVKDNPVSE